MARTRAFNVNEAVRAARGVFWERGYAGSSLPQIQQATGLSRSSIYEAFGSKRGLFDAVAAQYLTEVMGPLLVPLEQEQAGRDALVRYFRGLSAWLRRADESEARRGCLLVNTAMELNDLDSDAQELVGGFRERVIALMASALDQLPTVTNPVQRAQVLMTSQMGLLVTARLSPSAGAAVADLLADDVADW